jgi:hypothetical protein
LKPRDLVLLACGALLVAVPLVAYYERANARAGTDHEPTVSHGALRNAAPATDESTRPPGSAAEKAGGASAPVDGREPVASERVLSLEQVQRQLEQVNTTLRNVRQEKRTLEGQLRTLQAELAGQQREPADEFDLDQDDWKELAAKHKVKYRVPCMLPAEGTFKLPESELDELGLMPEDGDAVTEAYRRSNARVWKVVQPLCLEAVELPGVVDMLGLTNCLRVVEQVATKRDFKATLEARRQVAEVHAGMRTSPDPSLAKHPVFVADMALTSEARLFEADLAESFGPDEARRIARSLRCVASIR